MQPGTSHTASSVSLVRRLLFKFGIKNYFRKIGVTAIAEVLPAVLLKIPLFWIVRRILLRRIQPFLGYLALKVKTIQSSIMSITFRCLPVPLAARSKAYVCGRSLFFCCECCVLSGRGHCDEPITRPEDSYWVWCVVVCGVEPSRMRKVWPVLGRCATGKINSV